MKTKSENIRFNEYLHQKWANLCQAKTKMISSAFYTYHRIHFTGENASFCDICLSVCQSRTSHTFRLLSIGML